MCEIAILDTSEYSVSKMTGAAEKLYRNMRSSLGLVAVFDTGDEFEYGIYKSVEPDFGDVREFIASHEKAERLIIHGRLATHGEVNVQNAHPLEVNCDECNVDYVVHNGMVRQHRQLRRDHVNEGHEYETEVDSEAIAHETGCVPTDFDDPITKFGREPAYILLNSERIYVSTNGRYRLAESCEMATNGRKFGPDRNASAGFTQLILTPEDK